MVLVGLVMAWRLAGSPTLRSPFPLSRKATMEGVVLLPSLLAITVGSFPSITATQELVVPRSIPIIFPIVFVFVEFRFVSRIAFRKSCATWFCSVLKNGIQNIIRLKNLYKSLIFNLLKYFPVRLRKQPCDFQSEEKADVPFEFLHHCPENRHTASLSGVIVADLTSYTGIPAEDLAFMPAFAFFAGVIPKENGQTGKAGKTSARVR
jgi:hypothetical protein